MRGHQRLQEYRTIASLAWTIAINSSRNGLNYTDHLMVCHAGGFSRRRSSQRNSEAPHVSRHRPRQTTDLDVRIVHRNAVHHGGIRAARKSALRGDLPQAGFTHFVPGTIAYAQSAGVPFAGFLVPASGVLAFLGGASVLPRMAGATRGRRAGRLPRPGDALVACVLGGQATR